MRNSSWCSLVSVILSNRNQFLIGSREAGVASLCGKYFLNNERYLTATWQLVTKGKQSYKNHNYTYQNQLNWRQKISSFALKYRYQLPVDKALDRNQLALHQRHSKFAARFEMNPQALLA